MKHFLLLLLISFQAFAGTSSDVLIRGTFTGTFDETQAKVKDSLGQTYFIPTKYLPKGQKISQGQKFSIEVPEEVAVGFKLLK